MTQDKYIVKLEKPTADDFVNLRSKVGWGDLDLKLASKSLANSLFHITVYENSQLIGMGRVVGDGAMYFYIQDVVVDPQYQKQGIGSLIMEHIESYLTSAAYEGSTIGLFSAKGKEDFYSKYHYLLRPSDSLGHGMCKFI